MRRHPEVGPTAEVVLARFQKAAKDLARLENEVDDPEESLARVLAHRHYLESLPAIFADCEPLQQLFMPKAAASPPPPPPTRTPSGRLLPGKVAPSGRRPLFPENQALLDRGLSQLRSLETKMLVIRAACAIAVNPAQTPNGMLSAQNQGNAFTLAIALAVNEDLLEQVRRFADHHAQTKRIFDQRPLQQPDAAKAALEQLTEFTGSLSDHPKLAKLMRSR